MSSTIYLIRHAESVHNVTKDFNHRDPGLTELGLAQAASLGASFPALGSAAVVLTSPLTRTLETALAAFGAILHKSSDDKPAETEAGARLVVDPDLQERSDLPCDTGSDLETLRTKFPNLDFDLGSLGGEWYAKRGDYAADDAAVAARARRVRRKLLALANGLAEGGAPPGARRDIAVVTHGVFMKFLSGDETIDLPKAGWKAYTVRALEDGEAVLVPV